ncbi:MAG TPA: LD-carboxypeptidase [Thermoanaerobaculia bacterium]|nr:LD-carboxypeptidase [Thermoanaerobaculia bacterium]
MASAQRVGMGTRAFARPPRLKKGDTIGVAAVSRPVWPDKLAAGVATLESRGYKVVCASNVGLGRPGQLLAGTDAERADGYRELLQNPEVDAIFFATGGYGAGRILSRLDPRELVARPRIHLGGSDLTALFAYIGAHARLTTFYGPMAAMAIPSEPDLDWESVLTGATPAPHEVAEADVLAPGVAAGPLVGGCLSLIASLAGTPEQVDGRGAVLFWEDVGEKVYRLDRMLTQLERSGTFDGLQAMIIGSITPGAEGGESPEFVADWLSDRFRGAPFPVVRGYPAGHLSGNRTLPLGAPVRVDAEQRLVTFSEPAVV